MGVDSPIYFAYPAGRAVSPGSSSRPPRPVGSRPLVLHLVWGPLGSQPLRDFLAAYRLHDAGVEHDLAIVLNGVDGEQRKGPQGAAVSGQKLLQELEGTEHRLITLRHSVLDLVAYGQAIRMFDHEHVCILNSHSRIRHDGWLLALEQNLLMPGVGLVGASGSWASMRSFALYQLRLPSAYRRVWPDRSAVLSEFRGIDEERKGTPASGGLRERLNTARALADAVIGFLPFPAHHVRSNAFMAKRELLCRVLSRNFTRKIHTHRMESGPHGITRQVEQLGLRAVVC